MARDCYNRRDNLKHWIRREQHANRPCTHGRVRIWPADGGSPGVLDHGAYVRVLAWAPTAGCWPAAAAKEK